jgi:hypothetical protein
MRRLLLAFALLWAFPAYADPQATGPQGSSISVTNTFQQVWGSQSNRQYCSIQNTGTHTMYVYFGPTASATTSNSYQLSPGQIIYCGATGPPNGAVLNTQAVQITGTAADTYVYLQQ